MQDALRSLVSGMELKKPDPKHEVEGYDKRSAEEREAALVHYEGVLTEWSTQIQGLLESSATPKYNTTEPGPMTELDFWRRRMQKLTNVIEQLKTKENRNVCAVLTSATKSTMLG